MIKKILRLALSGFIALSSLLVLILRVFVGIDFYTGVVLRWNWAYLQYFTSLSNFYNGVIFGCIFVLSLIHFKEDDYSFSKVWKILALSATVGVTVTFLVTIFFLNFVLPDPLVLYLSELLFFHIINPLVTIALFLLLLPGEKISWKESLWGALPLFVYSIFYSVFVISGVWSDFYNFTFGGHYWTVAIALPVIWGLGFGLSLLFAFLNAKINKLK